MSSNRFPRLLGASAIALLGALPSLAQQPQSSEQLIEEAKPTQPASTLERTIVRTEINPGQPGVPGRSAAGLVAVRDAETGQIRAATAEELASMTLLADSLNRSDAGLVQRFYSDGTVGMDLEGRFQSVVTMSHEHTVGCNTDLHAASLAIAGSSDSSELKPGVDSNEIAVRKGVQ